MIQTTQKTVEILQVQFIDMVAEIFEIMPSKDKCQRSRRCGNSRKFTDKNLDVPIVLKRQCQPGDQVPDRIPKEMSRMQGCRRVRMSVHKQVRRHVQRHDSRERVVSGSRRNGARSA